MSSDPDGEDELTSSIKPVMQRNAESLEGTTTTPSQHRKPTQSSAQKVRFPGCDSDLALLALMSSSASALHVHSIYNFIKYYFAWRTETKNWQSSIRHALSKRDHFVHVDAPVPQMERTPGGRPNNKVWYIDQDIREKINAVVDTGSSLCTAIRTVTSKPTHKSQPNIDYWFEPLPGESRPFFAVPNATSNLAPDCAYQLSTGTGASRDFSPQLPPTQNPEQPAKLTEIFSSSIISAPSVYANQPPVHLNPVQIVPSSMKRKYNLDLDEEKILKRAIHSTKREEEERKSSIPTAAKLPSSSHQPPQSSRPSYIGHSVSAQQGYRVVAPKPSRVPKRLENVRQIVPPPYSSMAFASQGLDPSLSNPMNRHHSAPINPLSALESLNNSLGVSSFGARSAAKPVISSAAKPATPSSVPTFAISSIAPRPTQEASLMELTESPMYLRLPSSMKDGKRTEWNASGEKLKTAHPLEKKGEEQIRSSVIVSASSMPGHESLIDHHFGFRQPTNSTPSTSNVPRPAVHPPMVLHGATFPHPTAHPPPTVPPRTVPRLRELPVTAPHSTLKWDVAPPNTSGHPATMPRPTIPPPSVHHVAIPHPTVSHPTLPRTVHLTTVSHHTVSHPTIPRTVHPAALSHPTILPHTSSHPTGPGSVQPVAVPHPALSHPRVPPSTVLPPAVPSPIVHHATVPTATIPSAILPPTAPIQQLVSTSTLNPTASLISLTLSKEVGVNEDTSVNEKGVNQIPSSSQSTEKKVRIGGLSFHPQPPPPKKSRPSYSLPSAPPPTPLPGPSHPTPNFHTKAVHTSLPIPLAMKRKEVGVGLGIQSVHPRKGLPSTQSQKGLIVPSAVLNKGLTIPSTSSLKTLPISSVLSHKIQSTHMLDPEKRKELLAKAQPKSAVAAKVLADEMEEKQRKERRKMLELEDAAFMLDDLNEMGEDEMGSKLLKTEGERKARGDIEWLNDQRVAPLAPPVLAPMQDIPDIIYSGITKTEKIHYDCKSIVFGDAEGFKSDMTLEECMRIQEKEDERKEEEESNRELAEILKNSDYSVRMHLTFDSSTKGDIEKRKREEILRDAAWKKQLEKERKAKDALMPKRRRRRTQYINVFPNAPRKQPGIRICKNRMPFDPNLIRRYDTHPDGDLRRAREDWKEFFDNPRVNNWEMCDAFSLQRRVTGFLRENVKYKRENLRLHFARFNPNPEIPLLVTGGVNRYIYINNYQTGEMYSMHRPHATYATDGAWSSCGQYFIAAGSDQQVVSVSPNDVPTIKTRIHMKEPVAGVRFLQNKNICVIATKDGTLHVQDLRLRKVISKHIGIPEITCIDTNPVPHLQTMVAIGCANGRILQVDVMEEHRRKPLFRTYEKFDGPGFGSSYMNLPSEILMDYYDDSPIKSIRYSSANEFSEFCNDILVTKEDRKGEGPTRMGDSVYRLHWMDDNEEVKKNRDEVSPIFSLADSYSNGSFEKQPIVTKYSAPAGHDLSCASFAFLTGYFPHKQKDEKRLFHKEYVATASEQGFVFLFDGKTGEHLSGYAIPNRHHVGNDLSRYIQSSTIIESTKWAPIKNFEDSKQGFDTKLATQITAIDCAPDPHLGLFAVGGWGDNPNLFYFRINDMFKDNPQLANIDNIEKLMDMDNLSDVSDCE